MKSKHTIAMADPWISHEDIKAVTQAMKTGWTNYFYVEKFQVEFSKYHNRKYGIMTPNCHSAIHLLLLALDIKPGDEIIIPDCTWTGSAAPIVYCGAIPVCCDVEESTWCLDPKSVEKRITKKTKAIIAVDLFGNMPNMDALNKISKKYNIPIIEDAAEALGSKYKGTRAGKFGVASVFSFHRTKTLTTGEGGMLVLDDEKLYKRAMFLRDAGRSLTIPYWTEEVTPKYMPFNIQAAIGLAQFNRLEELLAKKRKIFSWYKKHLQGVSGIELNNDNNDTHNGVWATTLLFSKATGMTKLKAIEGLQKLGLPARPFFYPLSMLPAYSKYKTGSKEMNPVAYDISERGITLPAAYSLTEKDVVLYCEGIKKILA